MQRAFTLVVTIALACAVAGCVISPDPLTETEISALAETDLSEIVAGQEDVAGPIDLYEAMARAVKYNLDHRVEEMEASLRLSELNLSHFSLLPNAVASSGFAARDNFSASNSVNILTGQQSLATSTSQEKQISTADITFSWNILDFGLSLVRARQAADKYLISEEMRMRVINRIVEEVRTAYWRAVSADRLIGKLSALESRIRAAQRNSKSISEDRQTSPITAVTYEREFVEIKRTIQELQRELSVARTQLSALMNLRPGTPFTLVDTAAYGELSVDIPAETMIWNAVNNRPELKEVWYRQRINDHELKAALLELLPGLTPYYGSNYDSNDFLYNNNWVSWGAKASWNLIKIFQLPAKRNVIEAQEQLLKARELAVTMAVITQVHVSRIRYYQYKQELDTAEEYLGVQKKLVRLLRAEASADRISEQTLIREEMNTLVAEAKRDISHASLQNSFAALYTAMGLSPYDAILDLSADLQTMTQRFRDVWVERGDHGAEVSVRRHIIKS